MALGSPSIGDMELMIASIRSGTAKVDPERADRLPAETGQADTEIAAPTATEPVDTEITEPTATKPRPTELVDTEIAAPTATESVDTGPVDTEQADPTAADTEKKETAPNGPDRPTPWTWRCLQSARYSAEISQALNAWGSRSMDLCQLRIQRLKAALVIWP